MVRSGVIIFLISAIVIAAYVTRLWNRELGDDNFFILLSVFVIAGFCLLGSAVMIVVGLVVNWASPNIE